MADENARLTADVVLFAEIDNELLVLLIQRAGDPHQGLWAVPGGHVDADEDVEAAAHRELGEETDLVVPSLELVGVYAAPGRDPRGRYVTWAFMALLDHLPTAIAGSDAAAVRWFPVAAALADPSQLAFDHGLILADAVKQLGMARVGGDRRG